MRKVVGFFLICFFSSFQVQENQDFFKQVDVFLAKYVQGGRVNYKAIRKNATDIKDLVSKIATFTPESKSSSQMKAFLLNAYNILVIYSVCQHYPIASPLDVDGFFDKKTFTVMGKPMTLSYIENEIIRKKYPDARIHFALVCAAKGCPPLSSNAYRPELLDETLYLQTKNALNLPDFIRVSPKEKKVFIPEIFKWYRDDFLAEHKTLIGYLNMYLRNPIPTDYTVDFYAYDWRLNE